MYKVCLTIFIFLVISISCTKEIEIDVPHDEAKLIIYSTIVPFTLPQPKSLCFDIQSSIPIFDTTKIARISDAIILLYSNNNFLDTIKYVDSLQNYPLGLYPNIGDSLHVVVIKDGYKSVSASTIIPDKVDIINTKVIPVAYFDETGNVYSEIEINFKDPANEINFYEIALSDVTYNYDNPDDYYNISTEDNIITSESYYPSLIRFDVDKPKYLLFNDKTINGKEHTISIYYHPPQSESVHRYITNHIVCVHLRNVTEEYYKFQTSMIQHLYGKESDILYGMSEPINVFTNIQNGYGVFAGFNNDIKSIQIDETIIDK